MWRKKRFHCLINHLKLKHFSLILKRRSIMSQHSNNQMVSGSDFSSNKPDLSGLKSHRIIATVLEGKSPSDYETAWSPTSPLDFRVFSSFGNPFGGSFPSRSIRKMHQKSWDSGKVGLSILDSLDDHHIDSSRILLPSPDSKNIIFGSLMRNGNNPKCHKPHLPYPMVEDFHVQPFAKIVTQKVDVIEVDSSNRNIGVKNKNACQVMKQSLGSLDGDIESDIEISEDYTCVTSHGSNPKITHFYGDQVQESVEHNVMKKGCCGGDKKESLFVIAPLDLNTDNDLIHSSDFLSYCWSCSKKLGMGKDIYMYRYSISFQFQCTWKLVLYSLGIGGVYWDKVSNFRNFWAQTTNFQAWIWSPKHNETIEMES